MINFCEKDFMPYRVGGLLYTPATNRSIAAKLKAHTIEKLTSIVFCLEDSIGDCELEIAEDNLQQILLELQSAMGLPLLFIRVRTPEHLRHICEKLGSLLELVNGFVLPKFDASNLSGYFREIEKLNQKFASPKYMMPIMESRSIAECSTRRKKLIDIKAAMASMQELILNVRVGGNDFSGIYGLRRNVQQNIYQIGVVRDILVDILNVFSDDYVVSGPVWEYYGQDTHAPWKSGLERELELDRLNGFIGKTAIHPTQLPVIFESLKPTKQDYMDAMSIIQWSSHVAVKGNVDGTRMKEVKTHEKWAKKVYILGKIYGTKRGGI